MVVELSEIHPGSHLEPKLGRHVARRCASQERARVRVVESLETNVDVLEGSQWGLLGCVAGPVVRQKPGVAVASLRESRE